MGVNILWILPPKKFFNSGVYQYSELLISSLKSKVDINSLNLPSGWRRYIYQFLFLPIYILKNKKNYTHIVMYDESVSFLSFFCKNKSVLIVHDVRISKAKSLRELMKKAYMFFNYKCIKFSFKVIAVSYFTKKCLFDLGIRKDSDVLYNIVNVVQSINENPNIYMQSIFNESRGSYFILNVGSHESRKNIPLLIDIVKQLGSRFVLIQAGRSIDKQNFISNIELAKIAGIKYHFLEEITSAELQFLYQNCNFLLNVSSFEGFGRTPIEAQANGLIVFSSDSGGLAEALSDGYFRINLDDNIDLIVKVIMDNYFDKNAIEIIRREGYLNAAKYRSEIISTKFIDLLCSD